MLVSNGRLVTKSPTFAFTPATTSDWFWDSERARFRQGSYGELYKRQLWVAVVVSKRARATARLPVKVYERDALNRPEADGHPFAELMRTPNPALSTFRFWEWTSSTYDVHGEAMWLKRRDRGGRPIQLVPLHPTALTLRDGGWDFDNGRGTRARFALEDVVHFRSWNPDGMERGLSPLEPLRDTLENEAAARTATSSFWRNGARPGTALMHKGNLSKPAADRLKQQWHDIAGGAGKTGTTVVLEEGMEPKQLTLSAEEAQYIDTRKLNREEVCAAYDMPPPAVHILDRATFNNITEQFRSVYRDTMAPHLKGFESDIETQLRTPDFGGEVYAEFLMDEVLRGDFEQRAKALESAFWMTIAEKRKLENLPFIEGTDRVFVNAATVPLDEASRSVQELVSPRANGAPDLPADAVRAVMGRLGWQKSLAEVDPVALVAGLNGSASLVLSELESARVAGEDVPAFRSRLKGLST